MYARDVGPSEIGDRRAVRVRRCNRTSFVSLVKRRVAWSRILECDKVRIVGGYLEHGDREKRRRLFRSRERPTVDPCTVGRAT